MTSPDSDPVAWISDDWWRALQRGKLAGMSTMEFQGSRPLYSGAALHEPEVRIEISAIDSREDRYAHQRCWNAAIAAPAPVRETPCWGVLAEMVALQDLKTSLAQANFHASRFPTDDNYGVIHKISTELGRRTPLAWEAARAALASRPVPEPLPPIGLDDKTELMKLLSLAERIAELVEQHGGLRAAARAVQIDPGYLSRLASGEKVAPQKIMLHRMGLRRVVIYERLKP